MMQTPDLRQLYVEVCKDRQQLMEWLVGIFEGCDGCRREAQSFVESLRGEDDEAG